MVTFSHEHLQEQRTDATQGTHYQDLAEHLVLMIVNCDWISVPTCEGN